MSLVEAFGQLSLGTLMLPLLFWVVNLAAFALHIPAVLIRCGFSGLRTMVLDHLRSVRLMCGRQVNFIRRRKSWEPKPSYPDLQFDRFALAAGMPTAHLRAARYGLGLVLPGVVCSIVFVVAMGTAHAVTVI